MKRMMALIGIGFALWSSAWGNPQIPSSIHEYSINPAWIEVYIEDSLDLSGVVIHTTGGDAIINQGSFFNQGYHILDSTNTTGFALNSQGDSIVINVLDFECTAYGNKSHRGVPPPSGESAGEIFPGFGVYCLSIIPTPGAQNQCGIPMWGWGSVSINEIFLHGTWEGSAAFIELYNASEQETEISGYGILCNELYRIPANAVIPPYGFYILDESEFPAGFAPILATDNIYLMDTLNCTIDQIGWSSVHPPNISFARFPDGYVDWPNDPWGYRCYNDETMTSFDTCFPSRGAPNRYQSPGLKVIGTHADTSGGLVNIFWTNPIWVANFDRAILRKSLSGFPQAPTDGQLVYEGPAQEFLGDQAAPGQTTYYTVFAHTSDDAYSEPDSESKVSVFMPLVSIDDEPLPKSHLLLECYPNPFNARVTIKYSAGELTVYNIVGQRLATLSDGESTAGTKKVVWHASGFPSGIYFVRLEYGGRSRGVKLTLVK